MCSCLYWNCYEICLDGGNRTVRDKTEQAGRLGYDSASFESNQLALPKFWINLTHDSSGFPEKNRSTHDSSGLPKK